MKRFIFISFILLFLASCGKTNETKSSTHKIYTTIYPIHFLVTELVHDDIKVVTVYPPGVDAHTYEPTIREMIDIARDRKSTRLNSSHVAISYAVFCLKK